MPQSAAVVSRVRRSTSTALDAAGGEAVCQPGARAEQPDGEQGDAAGGRPLPAQPGQIRQSAAGAASRRVQM